MFGTDFEVKGFENYYQFVDSSFFSSVFCFLVCSFNFCVIMASPGQQQGVCRRIMAISLTNTNGVADAGNRIKVKIHVF